MPRAKDTNIPISLLRECFDLDPTAPSRLRWRPRPLARFAGNERACRTWNTRFAGKPAGSLKKGSGYWVVTLKIARAGPIGTHRIVVALTKGEWPADEKLEKPTAMTTETVVFAYEAA